MAKDLIVFGEDWGGLPSSTQHLIRQLLIHSDRKVIWINSIGLRKPHWSRKDMTRLWRKATAKKVAGKYVQSDELNVVDGQQFQVINPKTIPVPDGCIQRQIAAWLLAWQIKPMMRKMGIEQPILWVSLPTAVDMVGHFGESAVVYYCGDDFSALAGVSHQLVCQRETQLLTRAALILAASPALYQKFPSDKTQLLSHGVDYTLFATPCHRATDLPHDGKPIAGYYGSISDWLDLTLLERVIQSLPDWHFVFIGRQDIDCSVLMQYPNVYFLGPRAHHQLPSYVQHWTASLLPFVNNAQIRGCNPLKLREYLAAGQPIVSTCFPAVGEYHDVIYQVTTPQQMVAVLSHVKSASIQASTPIKSRAAVVKESWQSRAVQLANYLEAL
ncbi:glycosyltransferase family 1 protein [Photobacterium nomapromontoriensis]|uniref:glycosyltransferase family 1 protein n=1 Tax=Photobacterium nomapromontoriensis TaxID=2910237 RepID=UPI003D12298A